jgi:hypothetical protein
MLWFSAHWFFLRPTGKDPACEKRAVGKGSPSGLLASAVALLIFFYLFPKPTRPAASNAAPSSALNSSTTQVQQPFLAPNEISNFALVLALVLAAVIGVATRLLNSYKSKILRTTGTDPAGNLLQPHAGWWGLAVAGATTLGVTSLIIYYTGSSYFVAHVWLMWAYLSVLCCYRLASLFGDSQ